MTKLYNIIGCEYIPESFYDEDDIVKFVEPCGSVTEGCKFLKKMYDFPEKDSRKLIITAFARNTKLWIQIDSAKSVRISQHKIEVESRLHSDV